MSKMANKALELEQILYSYIIAFVAVLVLMTVVIFLNMQTVNKLNDKIQNLEQQHKESDFYLHESIQDAKENN